MSDSALPPPGRSATLPAAREAANEAAEQQWRVLHRLEKGPAGVREADGAVSVRRADPPGFLLYGPHWQLPRGVYRLSFRCDVGEPRFTGQPVLGVEVIAVNRLQVAWHDVTAAELGSGWTSFAFTVAPELGQEGRSDTRFEFRFYHLGNADLRLLDVELARLPALQHLPQSVSRWRLLGRLQKGLRGRRRGDGAVRVAGPPRAGCFLYGGWPYLRLPRGEYRLTARCRLLRGGRASGPVLGIEVLGQSRWRGHRLAASLRPGAARGRPVARAEFAADDLADGYVEFGFRVPLELSLDAGVEAPFEVRLFHLGSAGFDIEAVELRRVGDAADQSIAAEPPFAAPAVHPLGRSRVVIVGNCQGDVIREAINRIEPLTARFDARYHFVNLPPNLHAIARRDLAECDVLLVQDIRDWAGFPLRDCVPQRVETIFFPPLRFATLWPFDAWNGPGDSIAAGEAPNLTFPYHDGLLARLRREIPDKEERLRVYRSLDWPGIINFQRLHALEERCLQAADRKFETSIGAFILDNFRRRQIFYTTVRPNGEVYGLLLNYLLARLGVPGRHVLPESLEMVLRNPQIPVHPVVAAAFGVKWANETTRYLNRGWALSWEAYVRSYIEHYG